MKKWMIVAASFCFGGMVGVFCMRKHFEKKIQCERMKNGTTVNQLSLMKEWVLKQKENHSVEAYLSERGYHRVAIYGLGEVGKVLLHRLQQNDIIVRYGIDQNGDSVCSDIEVYRPDDDLKKVDAVIVTPISAYEDIKKVLEEKLPCPIISFREILDNM